MVVKNYDVANMFLRTKPLACDPSSLPKYPPSKEIDAKLREEEARRGGMAMRIPRGIVKYPTLIRRKLLLGFRSIRQDLHKVWKKSAKIITKIIWASFHLGTLAPGVGALGTISGRKNNDPSILATRNDFVHTIRFGGI
ncbi:putative serine/threonine-protein kinase [Sesamum angolense]|uniref:Serine/threonine-protein kinase n=1 Tax=Sesamum angolense TaxID=2727404 RepID=A0AAE2BUH8_9LAMI|nr:putative serine/threonine-protein kinase [Sesamum angolense]